MNLKILNNSKIKFSILISSLLFIGLFVVFSSAFGGEKKLIKKLSKANFNYKNISIPYNNAIIRVVQTGNPHGETMFFIHGSPGDWTAWNEIIIDSSLQQKYNLLLIDRPGYGKTTLRATSSLEEQANVVTKALEFLDIKNCIIVSHSYGGGVALQLMINQPNKIKYNVFIAPTLCPDLQHPKWYNKIGKVINFILPKDLKSSNTEMMELDSCLIYNQNEIEKITTPITFIHGKKDWLVPFETVNYFKQHSNTKVKYIIEPKESHFILWSKPEVIINELNRF